MRHAQWYVLTAALILLSSTALAEDRPPPIIDMHPLPPGHF